MKYNTIIFDLDGTISNTESGIFKAFRKMMKEFGVDESKFDLKNLSVRPYNGAFIRFSATICGCSRRWTISGEFISIS